MKRRTQIEAELAQLALEIGGKSHSEAAKAVLDLYKGLALLEAEETIQQQLAAAQQDMQSQLRARNFDDGFDACSPVSKYLVNESSYLH